MINEIAGNLAVHACFNFDQMNEWLEQNADVEVLDFKFSGIGQVLVVYRKEDV
ncbi:hypothetical protein [Bacillus sp. JCM 19034]|uniref:hypothetical protein n=1 Tax=Bacillus sp. JCM 19034 TaxID=1481928 RepID=UPI0018D0E01C|nr:hypothetical protein [Bacillus sp. JCM 19034]